MAAATDIDFIQPNALDRRAATLELERHFCWATAREIEMGNLDDHPTVQALARHRVGKPALPETKDALKDAIVVELDRQSSAGRASDIDTYLHVGERSIGVPDELILDGEINLDALAGAILKFMETV